MLTCFLALAIAIAGFNGSAIAAASSDRFAPLNINRLNLIFVPSADKNAGTGLMTPRGLQRSLRMASWLEKIMVSVGDIHAVAPTTAREESPHAYNLTSLETVEQLALEYDAPIDASAPAQCASPCRSQGLDATDIGNPNGVNEKLVERIIAGARFGATGNHVLSMPAALLNNLLAYVNAEEKYHLKIPPINPDQHNTVYVISIDRANHAVFSSYRFPIDPPSTYPRIRLKQAATCPQKPVTISTKAMGLKPVAGINTDEKVYFVRHVEAHPNNQFENGNYVCQGQWRALGTAGILYRRITASSGGHLPHNFQVYGPDPSYTVGPYRNSYVRAALTVYPFAIAYGLPMHLMAGISWKEWSSEERSAIHFFFTHHSAKGHGPNFSGSTLLIGWEHDNIEEIVKYLLENYYQSKGPANAAQLPRWNGNDYDTIWVLSLDAKGNLTFRNECEGVASESLPTYCPRF